jgi:hypothetical protein
VALPLPHICRNRRHQLPVPPAARCFAGGDERYGKPSNPEFLLQSQEMLGWVQTRGWRVLAFEEGYADLPRPAMVQRLCAARGVTAAPL